MATFIALKSYAKSKGLGYNHLRKLAQQGVFPVCRCGRKLYVIEEQADAWAAAGGSALAGGWRRHPKPAHDNRTG